MAVEMLEVELGPDILAGFSTRYGGASRGPWATANLGSTVGDDRTAVRANAADVESWLGSRPVFGHQVHGADVRWVDAGVAVDRAAPPVRCDGQVAVRRAAGSTAVPVGLGVLAADCLPVLFADTEAGVIATAHAGRRGLVGGVLQSTVATMVAAGARAPAIRAVIGPGICGRCYEVPADMQAEVVAALPATAATTPDRTPALDLPAGARAVLAALGLRSVRDLGICTATDDRFFSYRGAGGPDGVTGRFGGVVAFRGPAQPSQPGERG